jgi:hypothetical protein
MNYLTQAFPYQLNLVEYRTQTKPNGPFSCGAFVFLQAFPGQREAKIPA